MDGKTFINAEKMCKTPNHTKLFSSAGRGGGGGGRSLIAWGGGGGQSIRGHDISTNSTMDITSNSNFCLI